MCRRMGMCGLCGGQVCHREYALHEGEARYKIDTLNAKRIGKVQYVNGESLSILSIPVTLHLVEQGWRSLILRREL